MMKVTLINHSDSLGGASTVTFRLMQALADAGVDARMLVVDKASGSDRVTAYRPHMRARLAFIAEHLRIFMHNGMSRSTLFKISIATDGLPLSRHPLVLDADAVILNWVNQGMLALDEIGKIAAGRPVIWTMHDMWNLTGICHHAADCTKYLRSCHDCPLLGRDAGPDDLSATTFARKADLYSSSSIHFVAVSRWLAEKARFSALTRNMPLTVINNPYPVPAEQPAQSDSPREPIILMCAARLDDPVKNLPGAIEALNTLEGSGARAILAGNIRHPEILGSLRLPYETTGLVTDPATMAALYARAAVVMSASHYESFGATLLEGQAAGATPVGYVHDGRADVITDGVTGYGAGPGLRSLAEALRLAIASPISPEQLYTAAARYSYNNISAQYVQLITRMIDDFKSRS